MELMEMARGELARMRGSSAAWQEVAYEGAVHPEGYEYDAHEGQRAKVLWALQYDRRPEDLPLVRWLVEQEALSCIESTFAGIGEDTHLAGFLLAEYRQVQDVWLHWKVKTANFDTWCGYDLPLLYAAGVQVTIDFVRESDHEERDAVLKRLLDDDGQPHMTEEAVAKWLEHKRTQEPTDPAAEEPETWIDRALLAGENELALRLVNEWAVSAPQDKSTFSTLRYYLKKLGAFADAARVQRQSLAFADNAWDRASGLEELAELEREAGDHGAAWDALVECGRALEDVSDWTEVGLGRMYVEQLFLLAGAAEGELAAEAFTEADRRARIVPRLPSVALRAAIVAAENVGDQARSEHYTGLLDAEQARIHAELAGDVCGRGDDDEEDDDEGTEVTEGGAED